jgi:pimeloyl-ACP methyl ester carboxylesterase
MLAGSSVGSLARRQLDLDGLRLSYLEQGSATQGTPSLVLLHGLMGCADTFAPLLAELDPRLHVIALDFPGAGQSERREGIDASLVSTANLAARFIQQLGLHRPIVIGHSHGGAVAMSLAARHRDLLRSMVLLAPAHPWFDEGDVLVRFYLTLPGRLLAYSMPWMPAWLQMFGLRRMAGPKSWDSPERLKPYRDNIRTPGTMAHLLRLPGIGHRPAEETPALVAGFVQQWIEADLVAAEVAAAIRAQVPAAYSANSVASQSRRAAFMTSSFEAGD